MRILVPYIIGDTDGPVSVVEPASPIGVLKVDAIFRHASVFGVWEDILSANDRWHVTFVLLSNQVAPGLYRDSFRSRVVWLVIKRVSAEIAPAMPVQVGFDHVLRIASDIPFDVVVGGPAHAVRALSFAMSAHNRQIPGVVRHETGYSSSGSAGGEPWGVANSPSIIKEALASTCMSLRHAFLSDDSRKHFMSLFMRPFYSPSLMRRMDEQVMVFRNGVNIEHIVAAVQPDNAPRGRVVGSFYRITAGKGVPDVLDLYQKMLIVGQVDRAIITAPHEISDLRIGELGTQHTGFEIHDRQDRVGWLRKAAQTTAAIWNSRGEGSPIAPVEAAAVGCVPLFPDLGWARSMPSWPLLYKNMGEAHAMLLDVLANESEWRRKAIDWSRGNFDSKVLFSRFGKWVESVADEYRPTTRELAPEYVAKSKTLSALADWSRGRDTIAWSEIMRSFSPPQDRRGYPAGYLHHDIPFLLEHGLGFVDDLSGPVPTFRNARSK